MALILQRKGGEDRNVRLYKPPIKVSRLLIIIVVNLLFPVTYDDIVENTWEFSNMRLLPARQPLRLTRSLYARDYDSRLIAANIQTLTLP